VNILDESIGVKVLRLTNSEFLHDNDKVVGKINIITKELATTS
jgi:very-short-patch-repair endonuclease